MDVVLLRFNMILVDVMSKVSISTSELGISDGTWIKAAARSLQKAWVVQER